MPDYRDAEGDRVRVLLESRSPEVRGSLKSALLEMGVDPMMADYFHRKGSSPDEVSRYLESTKDSRTRRLRNQAPPQSSVRGIPSPWSEPEATRSGK